MGIFDTIKDKAGDLAETPAAPARSGPRRSSSSRCRATSRTPWRRSAGEAFELVEKGELTHPGLEAAIAKVRDTKKLVDDKKAEIEALKAED